MTASEWAILFRNCLQHRISSEDVKDLSNALKERNPLQPKKIVKIIIQCHKQFCAASDPLPSSYLAALTVSKLLTVSDVLSVLANEFASVRENSEQDAIPGDLATWTLGSRTTQDLIAAICDGKVLTLDIREVERSLFCLSKCIATAVLAVARLVTSNQNGEKIFQAVSSTVELTGNLLCAIIGSEAGMGFLVDSKDKEQHAVTLRTVNDLLGSPIPLSMLLRARLEEIQKHVSLYDVDSSKTADDALLGNVPPPDPLQFAASVPYTLPLHSRATLYIYLNAALCGRPMLDDNVLVSFLNARYGEDHTSLFIELTLAAFDVLSNGVKRKETAQAKVLYQSCLLNKIPSMLSEIVGPTVLPETVELCFTQILSRLDPTIFPSFSESVNMPPEKSNLSDMRQEFLFVCALHKLIPENSVAKLLGEEPIQSRPSRSLLSKQELTQQTLSGSRDIELLIDDILPMEGNSGIAVQALVEVIHHLCQSKETATLNSVCSLIVRKPEALDIICLFKTPAVVLSPLCTLLDEWKWGEVQSEKQPLYWEFGSILLLILTAKYRFDLEATDLGIPNVDSFVFRLLYLGPHVKRVEDLSESESTHLGSWIRALFMEDGLGDEVLSSCSPQEFYLLIPTLFSQSLDACEAGKLTFDTMKSGFDYLLEPFLLPSLVIALSWLKRHIWELNGNHANTFKVLHGLISPTSVSSECRDQHQTIVSMIALPMAEQLQNVLKRYSNLTPAKEIMTVLQPRLSFGRKNIVSRTELQSWTSPDVLKTLRNQLSSLLFWITAIEAPTSPPGFTFNLVNVAIQLRGACEVFETLFSFLCTEVAAGNLDGPLDIVLSIICSPSQTLGRHSLRDALKDAYNHLPKMLEKQENITAELLVRLHNLVEAHTHVPLPLPQQTALDATAVNLNLDDMDLNIATSGALESAVEGVTASQGGGVENIDDMLNAAEGFDLGGMGNLSADGLDDVFGRDGDAGDMDLTADLDFDLDKIF